MQCSDSAGLAKTQHLARRAGGKGYNGVHLRIEKDAEAWAQILGGRDVLLARCEPTLSPCMGGLWSSAEKRREDPACTAKISFAQPCKRRIK